MWYWSTFYVLLWPAYIVEFETPEIEAFTSFFIFSLDVGNSQDGKRQKTFFVKCLELETKKKNWFKPGFMTVALYVK